MNLTAVKFYGNSCPEFSEAAEIRKIVFLDEQQFSYDLDDVDEIAFHAVIYVDNTPIAAGRFFFDENNAPHIGRVAVLEKYRKIGVGRFLMNALEEIAAEQNASYVTLGAQLRAADFYSRIGYAPYGEIYYEEYCEHINMKKML